MALVAVLAGAEAAGDLVEAWAAVVRIFLSFFSSFSVLLSI